MVQTILYPSLVRSLKVVFNLNLAGLSRLNIKLLFVYFIKE
jgi:hypothetical protein